MSSPVVEEAGLGQGPAAPGGPRALTGRRTVILTALLGAGVILLGVSRSWGTVQVDSLTSFGAIAIKGSQAAPAGAAVALAVGAAALVLTIAGRVVRFLIPFGFLVAGVALAVSGVSAISAPDDAASDALRDTLSLGGSFLDSFDYSIHLNLWGWIYVVGAVLVALAGVLGVVGSRSWPVTGRRFERDSNKTGAASSSPAAPAVTGGWVDSADVWDAQNRGEDLTSDPVDSGDNSHSGDAGGSGGGGGSASGADGGSSSGSSSGSDGGGGGGGGGD
ncbi:Trp biosynthesis-associated membrane protein [Kineosporia sp. J2-2]|uniref:Trp biosynthesis-associated membrane protein n=1 Tax=Kineosporia corallincola TaxID=2835133 RepID=A0ABS5TH11_9ACTN|nr:Trp biosynthesis-associated membrane protein [Kineosporia corallincola]MBT0768894.1 Trp biosynthesis-associated membrane protein [Kineosporia corallincola]